MDPERQRILEDLRGLVRGDVRCDDIFLQLFASDASIYEIKPLAVVRPRGTADVAATVRYAVERQLPIHARGAGTGLAGESLGRGIVIDFSRYMRGILAVDGGQVTVQPGVVHARLNAELKSSGRQFGPDPAMSSVTTMGSVIAIDAGGSHWLKHGSARRHVVQLQIVLADGSVLSVGREPLTPANLDPATRKGQLLAPLAALLKREAATIAAHQPKSLVNRCGYQLADALSAESLNLAGLISGSEGTLALITEATLSTSPLAKHRAVTLLFFERLESAARAVLEIAPLSPSACDLMDRRHLSLARESDRRYDKLIPPQTEAVLLVEFEGDRLSETRARAGQLLDRMRRRKRWAFDAAQAQDPDETELYWRLARKVVPTLFRLKGSTRPLPCVEDFAVPPVALADFLVQMQNVLKQHQVTASLFAHAGHGQLHLRPFLDLTDPADVARMSRLASSLYAEVLAVGGTISGEHGVGLSRTPFMRQQYGPLVDVFREVKRIFDPQDLFNPGKLFNDDKDLLTKNLRASAAPLAGRVEPNGAALPDDARAHVEPTLPPQAVKLQLRWTEEEIAAVARSCNGCGACRSQLPEVRMCPVFRMAPAEEAAPRAKANLMRAILTGQLDAKQALADDFKDIADLCVHCHMCRQECPASVDIPRLMTEAKATYVAANGLSLSRWALSVVDTLSAWGSALRPLANWAIANPRARWLLEQSIGIASGRKLPRFSPHTFMRLASRRRWTRPPRRSGQKVLYFVDTYVNYHDPQLGEALVAVLEHNGVAVFVHPGQRASGMALIAAGSLASARKLAARNLAVLAEAVRQGYRIVASEPSAALCLTREYPSLLDDDDARLVAENTSEACDFLWRLHENGKLQLDFRPVNITLGYHLPCHLKALGVGAPGENLLRLIPGLQIKRIECGCSGMAGAYGLSRENFRSSLRAGRDLINAMRSPRIQAGITECCACKMQMEQGTDKPTIHPIKALALAYDLLPEVADLMTSRSQELTVT
jgi:FAD/FMN-containing dehydrogenase/Fe-S oxidoreductase